MNKVYVPGSGNQYAKIMFLGEAPSYDEVQSKKAFTGPSGKELTSLCNDAKINRNDCWITNVCKYMVSPNLPRKKIPFHIRAQNEGIDINQQIEELQVEINSIKPNIIVGLGGTALWALTGKNKIGNYRGSLMLGMGRKSLSTYHPAHLLHTASGGEFKGYWNRQVMVFDFKRALKESITPELELPVRTLEVCKNSAHLLEFYNRYRNKLKVCVDIEASGTCVPVCIGIAFNRHHGMTIPLWNTNNISSIPTSDLVSIWTLLAEILISHEVAGQNFNYDKDKIKRLGFAINHLASDTMLKAFAINPELPKKLAFNQSIYTREPFYKDEGMYEGGIDELLKGCARDACVTCEIDEEMDADLDELGMRPFYENFLMKLPDFYLEIEQNGFRVNPTTRDILIHKYVEWDERLRYELFNLVGTEINVNSPKQISELLFSTLKLPPRNGTGEEELTTLLNLQSFTNENHRKIVELILEDRRVRKTISTYLMALPDYDGRMKTTCFPCLDTGRSSNGQQDPPIRPTVEIIDENGKKKKKSFGIAFQTITKHGDIGQDVRSMYEPLEEDEVFIQFDSSQAEARVCSLLARDEKMLASYDTHDIHALTASWFFGKSENDYSKKILGYECPERFIGKTLRHAGERGAKKRRAASEVNTSARKYKVPIKITEADAEKALTTLHKMCPNIQGVYFNEVIEALKLKRRLYAPIPYGIDAPLGGVRTFFERWGDELFRMAFSYLPQRAVSDNTKAAGIRIKIRAPHSKLILESHDSLLFSIKKTLIEDFIPIGIEEMERPIDFSKCSLPRHELSIPCEVEIGLNYMELNKFKFERDRRIEEIPFVEIVDNRSITERFMGL